MQDSLKQFVAANFEGESLRLVNDWLGPLLNAEDITTALNINSLLAGGFKGNRFYLQYSGVLQPLFVHASACYVEGMQLMKGDGPIDKNEGIMSMLQIKEPIVAIARFCGKDGGEFRVGLAKAMEK